MQIVPTGVHHRDVASGIIFGANFTGIGETGFFFHGKRVQFRAQHDGWASPVLEDRDHSCAANMFGDVIAGAAQARGQLRCGLRFMRRKFGILVQIKVERVRVGIDAFNFFGRRSLRAGNGRERGEQNEF